MQNDTKRGALVVGASLAALTAGWYIYRWYQKREHEEELESAKLVQKMDDELERMNKPKRIRHTTNGRHKAASS